MVMHVGNGVIKVYFFTVILLMMQKVAIQLLLLVCDTNARTGILIGKDVFEQVGCWQDFTNRIVYRNS